MRIGSDCAIAGRQTPVASAAALAADPARAWRRVMDMRGSSQWAACVLCVPPNLGGRSQAMTSNYSAALRILARRCRPLQPPCMHDLQNLDGCRAALRRGSNRSHDSGTALSWVVRLRLTRRRRRHVRIGRVPRRYGSYGYNGFAGLRASCLVVPESVGKPKSEDRGPVVGQVGDVMDVPSNVDFGWSGEPSPSQRRSLPPLPFGPDLGAGRQCHVWPTGQNG